MDLYHKKVNLGNKSGRRPRYAETDYNPPKKNENIYIQKMIPKNETFNFVTAGDNIPNVRSSMEDLFSNEDNKKRAIKYVINIGKNKNTRTTPNTVNRRFEKSASPNRGRGLEYPLGYEKSSEATPNRRVPDRRGESQINNRSSNLAGYNPMTNTGYNNIRRKNKFMDYNNTSLQPKRNNYNQYNEGEDEEYYENPPNYINIEGSNNDLELSSINGDDKIPPNLKNVEPKILNRVKNVLNETYERAARRVRNKEINAMPKIIKPTVNKMPNKPVVNNINTNNVNTDEDMDDLMKELDDMQLIIDKQKQDLRRLKKDNANKDKEILLLKNDLDNMQKELDDKRLEHDKEIDDIFRNNDNAKLKNEYYKLLQDYDTNINDYNNLKDDYNKMVDEYNNIKNEKNKLFDDNKNLKQNNTKLKQDYNDMKNEANKALDDYNNIVDDYNKLEKEVKTKKNNLDLLQNENDRLKKDYERLRTRSKGKLTDDKKDQEYNKLCDDYDKLNEEFNQLNNDLNALKDENDQLRDENNKLRKDLDSVPQGPKDEDIDMVYDEYNKLKDVNKELKKNNQDLLNNNRDLKRENERLKNIFDNNNYNTMTPNRNTNISQFEESPRSPEVEDPTKLKDNYDKLKSYYKTLVNEYNKLKDKDKKMKQEYNKLVDDFNKVYTDKYKSDYANILMNNENNKLKE